MKTRLLFISFFLIQQFSFSQNLVPNSSFEAYDTCPNNYSQFYHAIPWLQPAKYAGNVINSCSSDYYNSCSTNPRVQVPLNGEGFQYARTGNAYAGIFFYTTNDTREYLEVKLIDSLTAGKKYFVEYYVSMGFPFTTATDNFHFYFSNDSLLSDTTSLHAIRVKPSVVNQLGNYIRDTLNWTKVSGTYIAMGGEKFLTIGNFYDNAHTDTIISGTSAYYYVDDVCVSLDSLTCNSIAEGISQVEKNTAVISPNPATNNLTISTNTNTPSEIILYDIASRKLMEEKFIKEVSLNIAHLAKGVYLYQVIDERGMVSRGKVVKE